MNRPIKLILLSTILSSLYSINARAGVFFGANYGIGSGEIGTNVTTARDYSYLSFADLRAGMVFSKWSFYVNYGWFPSGGDVLNTKVGYQMFDVKIVAAYLFESGLTLHGGTLNNRQATRNDYPFENNSAGTFIGAGYSHLLGNPRIVLSGSIETGREWSSIEFANHNVTPYRSSGTGYFVNGAVKATYIISRWLSAHVGYRYNWNNYSYNPIDLGNGVSASSVNFVKKEIALGAQLSF